MKGRALVVRTVHGEINGVTESIPHLTVDHFTYLLTIFTNSIHRAVNVVLCAGHAILNELDIVWPWAIRMMAIPGAAPVMVVLLGLSKVLVNNLKAVDMA